MKSAFYQLVIIHRPSFELGGCSYEEANILIRHCFCDVSLVNALECAVSQPGRIGFVQL